MLLIIGFAILLGMIIYTYIEEETFDDCFGRYFIFLMMFPSLFFILLLGSSKIEVSRTDVSKIIRSLKLNDGLGTKGEFVLGTGHFASYSEYS